MWARCGLGLGPYLDEMWAKFVPLIMATINFIIQTSCNPSAIYIRFKEGRIFDIKAKTNLLIDPINWSNTKGQPKNLKEATFKKLNADLINLKINLLNHFNSNTDKNSINTEWLKNFINPTKITDAAPNKLIDYFDFYALHKKSSMKPSSYKKLFVNKHLVERFEKATRTTHLINDVNADFKLQFEAFCKKEGYAANTVARAIKFIKTICYHAQSNGIETHFQLNNIKTKTEKVEKIFLSPEEIEIIQNADVKLEHLINARDWLVISCETGQRVSDFMRFTKEQIRFEGKVPLCEFTQVKTNKIMAIPLSKKVRDLLAKREGNFPRKISDQRYNEYIKEVCRIAGIKSKIKGSKVLKETKRKVTGVFPKYELVTSHIGRRSFATNNYGKIPTSLLINVTGHTTEAMFLEYIGKTETEKAKQLAEYF
jgi:integrase